jgi:response regulator of citrate/malate metabolism
MRATGADYVVVTDRSGIRFSHPNPALIVKPFGFTQLRDQLEAYRRWHGHLTSASRLAAADQATIDELYRLLRSGVLESVREAPGPVSATEISGRLGISRPTAQRYLSELERRGVVELVLEYGSTGRPSHLYRISTERS